MTAERHTTMDQKPTGTADEIRSAVAALLDTDPGAIAGDDNLALLGLGSLDVMRLSSRWRRAGVPVEFEVLVADPTIDGWARHLDTVRPDSGESGGSDGATA
ncbi:phosphopantetheine-binding protein [Streptomyces sp. NPDC050509]|uniref:phosphopantetheine-binding protein n=1 Tax=Streptomyces sp. NPDC050509 TaxID=3365620 RepID=UPI0037BCAD8E